MKKFIITILLTLSMLLSSGYKAYAAGEVASALAVAGGSIGTAGLVAGSIPALPIAAGLAAGALIAVGINIALTDASKQEGMTKSQFMQAKLEEWGAAAGKTKDQIADSILSGATVARDGTIYLGKEAGKLLNQFGNWLYGEGMVSNTAQSGDMSITFDGVEYPVASELTWSGTQKIVFSTDVAFLRSNDSVSPITYAFSNQQFTAVLYDWDSTLNDWKNHGQTIIDITAHSGSYYYQNCNAFVGSGYRYGISIPLLPSNVSVKNFLASLDGTWNPSGDALIDGDGFTGDEEDWQAKGDVLLPADGEAIALSPGLLGTIADQIGDIVKDGTIAVKDYVDAVIDAVNDLPIDIPVTDDKTGVIEIPQIPAIPYEDTASIEDVPDTDVPTDKDPIIDSTIPVVPDGGGVDALGSLTLDLKSVFPFCLPFDAVDMIKLLNVPAQAPFYHVHVPIPAVNQSVDFDLDLSPFDSVAAVARKMEIILFCVGLALATRQIIRS